MTTQTQLRSNVEAELLADYLDMPYIGQHRSAAELRRQASVIKDLMDEVARLNQAVADAIAKERKDIAKHYAANLFVEHMGGSIAGYVNSRGNT